MPRKTRILHGEDEYLFVDAPGDAGGPALLIFARPENRRAVAPGRRATHQSEHGLWIQVARFDGRELLLAPEPPEGLDERLRGMLPRYAAARREHIEEAKHPCFWVAAPGGALHALHPAQPAGMVIRLWRDEETARERAAGCGGEGGEATVQSTGNLREFLELRTEEGFAGALLDDEEIIFFCLDEESRIQFLKVSAPRGAKEAASHLLDGAGRWEPYEGAEDLEPFVDPDAWDRLMVRTFRHVPFVGYGATWRCFALLHDGEPATLVDPEGDGRERMLPLFHEADAADRFRTRHRIARARVEPVADLVGLVRRQSSQGVVARLHPGGHRACGGTMWLAGEELMLDGFAGIWRSRDGRTFTPSE